MKILHILDHSLPLHSGYAFRSQNILLSQLKMGLQPMALTSPKHEGSWKEKTEKDEIIGGVHYLRSGTVPKGTFPLVQEFRIMATLGRRIHEVALLERPNILHAHSPILNALPALWVGHKLGIPVVYEIRAFWEDAAVDHGSYGQNSWKYWLVALPVVLNALPLVLFSGGQIYRYIIPTIWVSTMLSGYLLLVPNIETASEETRSAQALQSIENGRSV